jgi:hypothetical protein
MSFFFSPHTFPLSATQGIDDTLSGTTAIAILFFAETMYICNVGDSRAILAQRVGTGSSSRPPSTLNPISEVAPTSGEAEAVPNGGDGNGNPPEAPPQPPVLEELKAYPLSDDQTPYRKDERERVKKSG